MFWVLDDATSETIASRPNRELDRLSPFQGLALCLDPDRAEGVDAKALRRHVTTHMPSRAAVQDDGI